jgi:hypothetical protein
VALQLAVNQMDVKVTGDVVPAVVIV